MKATVSGVLEDLKFKISEGSDQNWSCPESALLAVSANTGPHPTGLYSIFSSPNFIHYYVTENKISGKTSCGWQSQGWCKFLGLFSGRDSRWMSYELAAILNQNHTYIPHIIGKKSWKLLSVLCSLWGRYAWENLQCVFSLQTLQCAMFWFSPKLA